jgi:flagellar basal body-associated protein FliL
MAFFYEPNDPSLAKSSIYRRPKYDAASNVVSLVTVLLLVAVAYGLYLLYAGSAPNQIAVAPPASQSSPREPAAQPPAQAPAP